MKKINVFKLSLCAFYMALAVQFLLAPHEGKGVVIESQPHSLYDELN